MSYNKKQKWPEYCTPLCVYLECSKNSIGKVIRKGKQELLECLFVSGDFCTGQKCNYSYCSKRSFRSDGKCGQWVSEQKKHNKKEINDDLDDIDDIEEDSSKYNEFKDVYSKMKGKALKKFKYDDDY